MTKSLEQILKKNKVPIRRFEGVTIGLVDDGILYEDPHYNNFRFYETNNRMQALKDVKSYYDFVEETGKLSWGGAFLGAIPPLYLLFDNDPAFNDFLMMLGVSVCLTAAYSIIMYRRLINKYDFPLEKFLESESGEEFYKRLSKKY